MPERKVRPLGSISSGSIVAAVLFKVVQAGGMDLIKEEMEEIRQRLVESEGLAEIIRRHATRRGAIECPPSVTEETKALGRCPLCWLEYFVIWETRLAAPQTNPELRCRKEI